MQQSSGLASSSSSRIEALRAKHRNLSLKIEKELSYPYTSDTKIIQLKRKKLKIKEEIEGIREAS